jgi:chromosome segregation protein
MYLKKLEINGFKSFAQKTTLEFTQGITAIVGPNGSGKSNVSDALRWAMGEQSIKTLRGKKSEDVIFSGSDKKARLGLAEVSMELDNSDKKVPLEYSDLVITRKIYRSGESEYLVNNSKSKLSDINLLLTQANFGHHTYAIIGQGMIDNFLIATPEERKDFFEEATGVKQYQIKKNQTISKLQQVGQNLSAAQIKIQEMEPHPDF